MTRSSVDTRAFRLHAGQESRQVDNEALMRTARDELDFVDRLGVEGHPATLYRDDPGFNANTHAKRGGLEMLDREPRPNAGLAQLELRRNRENRRGLEPVAEDGGREDGYTGIFEPVGCVFGSDHLLEAANLTHAHLLHAPTLAGERTRRD